MKFSSSLPYYPVTSPLILPLTPLFFINFSSYFHTCECGLLSLGWVACMSMYWKLMEKIQLIKAYSTKESYIPSLSNCQLSIVL